MVQTNSSATDAPPPLTSPGWVGNSRFLLWQIVLKDFRIRYRNMSLGVFWSVLNPLVMIVLLTFIFTQVFTSTTPKYPMVILTGLIPFNFFALAWSSSTTSLIDNSSLFKRIPIRTEMIPVAVVLANLMHLVVQLGLLIVIGLFYGVYPNWYWLWLPLLWGLELICIMGLGLATAALHVVVRDVRYVVESVNTVLFWLVPIFYTFAMVPDRFKDLYQYNPVSALVLASRLVILEHRHPPETLLWKLTLVSAVSLALGLGIFRRLQSRFYSYL